MKLVADVGILVIIVFSLYALARAYKDPALCEIDPVLMKLKSDLAKVDPKSSAIPFFPGDESYTEDKEKVFICLKDKKGKYYSYNMLLHVGLHELAHVNTSVIDPGHTSKEFNDENKRLIGKAVELGLLDPNEPLVKDYCPQN